MYTCHGSWTHNGTQFIVAKHVGSQHGVCMSYRTIDAGSAQLVIGDVCLRSQQLPMEHHLVANLSVYGESCRIGVDCDCMANCALFSLPLLSDLSPTDHTGLDREAKCSDTNRGSSWGGSLASVLVLIMTVVLLDR